MKKSILAAAVLASSMINPVTTMAETKPLDEQLLKCFEMTDELKRIVCYDTISRSIAKANPEKQEIIQKRAVADFGLAHQQQSSDEMIMQALQIERLPGGMWKITMENGQVWQQTKEERFGFSSQQPKVRVFKMLFGSYAMVEEGRSKKIRVRRIK